MTKLKTHLVAIILAIVLVLACIVPTVSSINNFASASESSQEVYDKLYYFSDNENCEERFNGYIQDYLQEYSGHTMESELINWSGYDEEALGLEIMLYFWENDVDFSDSLIIFELTRVDINNVQIYLNDYFKLWYNNRCKIMFISDQDEVFYRKGYDMDGNFGDTLTFLELYTDFHFNTDVYYTFITSVIYYVGHLSNELSNCTFLLDSSIAKDIDYEYLNPYKNMYLYIIYKYLTYYYLSEMKQDNFQPISGKDILTRYNVNLLFYCGNNTIYDAVSEREFYISSYGVDDELRYMVASTELSAVGTSSLGDRAISEFFDVAEDLSKYCFGSSEELSKFFYNPDYLFYDAGPYMAGEMLYFLESILSQAIYDFILGFDLTVYDNFPLARCKVTYKPIPFEGWLYDLRRQYCEADDANFDNDELTEYYSDIWETILEDYQP